MKRCFLFNKKKLRHTFVLNITYIFEKKKQLKIIIGLVYIMTKSEICRQKKHISIKKKFYLATINISMKTNIHFKKPLKYNN